MIKFEKVEIWGFEHTVRGMRNPMNSWDKSDSISEIYVMPDNTVIKGCFKLGQADLNLMKKLVKAGTDHGKFLRQIMVSVDIIAPFYWWKEFDTYKVGTVANSCSTMHKIHEKEFTLDDFSHEHLDIHAKRILYNVIDALNGYRNWYVTYNPDVLEIKSCPSMKDIWWQMIQLLPSSYNQKRTVTLNYEVLANIYKSRKDHKLDEWSVGFMNWIKSLPYSELITGDLDEER